MPRVGRTCTRTRQLGSRTNRFWTTPAAPPAFSTTNYTGTETCVDMVGRPVVASPLLITGYKKCDFFIDVRASCPAPGGQRYHGEHTAFWPGVGLVPPTAPSPPSGWELDLIAGSNPNRPVVTPPTMIQNFVELPYMIRDLSRLLRNPRGLRSPQGVASTYLGVKFGWMTLAEDMAKLMGLYGAVLNRARDLNRMSTSGRGLRRRVRFRDEHSASAGVVSWQPHASANSFTVYSVDDQVRTWGTVTWYPTHPPPYSPSDSVYYSAALRTILGLTPEGLAKGLWDVIPWTWLLGWASNVGKYMYAYGNTVPCRSSNACFMSQTTRTVTLGQTLSVPSLFGTTTWERSGMPSGSSVAHSSRRFVGGAGFASASMPFLDMERLSVLSALATQRLRR